MAEGSERGFVGGEAFGGGLVLDHDQAFDGDVAGGEGGVESGLELRLHVGGGLVEDEVFDFAVVGGLVELVEEGGVEEGSDEAAVAAAEVLAEVAGFLVVDGFVCFCCPVIWMDMSYAC